MNQTDHDISALLAHLEEVPSSELAFESLPTTALGSSSTMIIMVGGLTESENGIPMWQSHTGSPLFLA